MSLKTEHASGRNDRPSALPMKAVDLLNEIGELIFDLGSTPSAIIPRIDDAVSKGAPDTYICFSTYVAMSVEERMTRCSFYLEDVETSVEKGGEEGIFGLEVIRADCIQCMELLILHNTKISGGDFDGVWQMANLVYNHLSTIADRIATFQQVLVNQPQKVAA